MMAVASPWSFRFHPFGVGAVALGMIALVYVHIAGGRSPGGRSVLGIRKVTELVLSVVCLAAALTWPVADLAHHYSLLARIVQNLLLCLAAPGLLLAGLDGEIAARITRPVAIHSMVRFLTRPAMAFIVFNASVIGAQLPPVVRATSSSWAIHGLVDATLFVAGVILWIPVVRIVPGARGFSNIGRAGYLFVQSLIPNFVSLVYIFAKHPLYPVYARGAPRLGISALLDQQLAGALSKIVGIFVLWGTALVVLFRTSRAEDLGLEAEPLTWEDVERELRRLQRRNRHVQSDS